MGVNLVARPEADAGNAGFAHPVDAVGAEVPLAHVGGLAPQQAVRLLASLHERVVFGQHPRGEVLLDGKDEPCVGGLVVEEHFDADFVALVRRNERLHLGDGVLFGFAPRHAAVNDDGALVGHRVDAGRLALDVRNGDAPLAQKVVRGEPVVQVSDAGDDGQHLVNGVVPQVVGGRVGALALGDHFHLHAPLVAPVNAHLGGLADDHEVRTKALVFHKGVGGNAVAQLLHVAEVVGRPALQQAQVAGKRQAVDHAGRAALLVAGPARVEDAIFDFALKGVPRPRLRVADANGVQVAVVEEHALAVPNAAQHVAHGVEENIVEPQRAHFLSHALAHLTNLTVVAGNGTNLAQEGNDRLPPGFHTAVDFVHDFRGECCRHAPRSSRTYGMPRAAGAPTRRRSASRDPMTSTTMVNR